MDEIYKSLSCGDGVAISVLDTAELVREGIRIHRLGDGAARFFGCMLTFAAYLGGGLKSVGGAVSVTVKSPDGGSASVSCDGRMHVRGCIDGDPEKLLKGGTLTVISEDGYSRPFVGTCLMSCDDISRNFEEYFRQSAQTLTFVKTDCKTDGGKCTAAGGVVASCLPEADEEEISRCRAVFGALTDVASEICAEGAEKFSVNRFGGREIARLTPVYRCNCSREKIAGLLRAMGEEEVRSLIAERGCVSVHCHYCNKDYNFFKEDADGLFPHAAP